jgi:hypothetical protein
MLVSQIKELPRLFYLVIGQPDEKVSQTFSLDTT